MTISLYSVGLSLGDVVLDPGRPRFPELLKLLIPDHFAHTLVGHFLRYPYCFLLAVALSYRNTLVFVELVELPRHNPMPLICWPIQDYNLLIELKIEYTLVLGVSFCHLILALQNPDISLDEFGPAVTVNQNDRR